MTRALPKIGMPKIGMPKIGMPKTDLPKMDPSGREPQMAPLALIGCTRATVPRASNQMAVMPASTVNSAPVT